MMEKPIPTKYLPLIISLMHSFPNETNDFNKIYYRPTLSNYIGPIVTIYLIIFIFSQIFTFLMIKRIITYQKSFSVYGRTPFDPLLAVGFNDFFIKGILVLPFSVIILITINWTYGSFLCFTFPMLQDSCFHVTSITYVIIFSRRYKTISKIVLNENFTSLTKYEYVISSFWVFTIAWTICTLGSLPYSWFIVHIPISPYLAGHQFAKAAVCSTNPTGNTKEYIRILFLTYYVTPIAMVLSYHSKITTCMKNWQQLFNLSPTINLSSLSTIKVTRCNSSATGPPSSPRTRTSVTTTTDCYEVTVIDEDSNEININCDSNLVDNSKGRVSENNSPSYQSQISPKQTNNRLLQPNHFTYSANRDRGSSIVQSLVPSTSRSITMSSTSSISKSTSILPHFFLEQSFHRILVIMFTVHGLTLLPINILRIWKHVVVENNENGSLFDILFITFVAIKYSSVPISSSLFYFWQHRHRILIEICLQTHQNDHKLSTKSKTSRGKRSTSESYNGLELESSSV
ncbi:uncharacterized protein LOC128391043 [Panonychus citri]|uniref:uncharacterized protein LOC128391043 n=1 Tax=Panonychus citri TaxID=50023 RepID=UPI002306FE26|nr:uncharacterized protein LOC128391043 [Panonychus citri]